MRLTLDLRLEPRTEAAPDERLVDLTEFAAMLRTPRPLFALLRGERWDEVATVLDTDIPPSAVQAGSVGLAGFARTRRFRRDDRAAGGRLSMLAAATVMTAVALVREVPETRGLLRRARAAAARSRSLVRRLAEPRSVLYLRTDPGIRWHGQLVGGASTHTSGVINGFVAAGVDIEVLATERPEWTESVPFTPVPVERVYHLVPWLTPTRYGEDVARAVGMRRPDFVYQRYTLGTLAGLEIAEKLGVPLVLEYNGSELWGQRHWGSGRDVPFFSVVDAVERRNLKDASLIVVVSDPLREQLVNDEGIEPERVLVNPNGVDVERVAEFRAHDPAHWRRENGLPDAPTVGFVGSFGLWHGVLELPAMVEELARLVPDARWVLVGDGPLFARVRDEIAQRGLSERVHMPGIVPHDRALSLLAAAEVCVSPHVPNPDGSRFFGSPTKLFEYMGLAKPIVASDLEQLGEVIDDGRTGVLVPPEDAGAAATAVARLLGDEKERARLGQAALESAQRDYSWEAHVRRILEALAR